jgi:uncharacterized protein (TIGR00255 family)
MIKSMTGYGRAEGDVNSKKITVEVKTLNSKQFDMMARIPAVFKEKEILMRSLLQQTLERGKIEITVTLDDPNAEDKFAINTALIKKYYYQMQQLQEELGAKASEALLPALMKMPEVIQPVTQELKEDEWAQIENTIRDAIGHCNAARLTEGAVLEADFTQRIASIKSYLENIALYEDRRIARIRDKIKLDLEKFFSEKNIDENRLEQEIVYYVEKIDITEEKVRLLNHCHYFMQTLGENHVSNGKKLNFISQELGREINTIGSKANDSDMQKLVVQMKDELEKIKEQLFNIL